MFQIKQQIIGSKTQKSISIYTWKQKKSDVYL